MKAQAVVHLIFADLNRLSVQRSIALVFVSLPLLGELGGTTPSDWLPFVEAESSQLSVLFINVWQTFRSLPNDDTICLYRKNGHFSTQGNAFVARAIYEQLRRDPAVSRAFVRLESRF